MMKTDSVVKLAKEKASAREAEVLNAIEEMKASGEKVTFYSVMKRTGAAKSYLYNSETLRATISSLRGENRRNAKSTEVLLKAQQKQIQKLEAQLKALPDYKAKCEALMRENEELKKQLQIAYDY